MMLGPFKQMLALCGYPQRFRSPVVVAQAAVPASVTGTTAETTLATVVIPANTLKSTGRLRIRAGYVLSSSTSTKTVSIRVGGTVICKVGPTVTAYLTSVLEADFMAAASTSAQVAVQNSGVFGGATGSALVTTSLDMTQAQSITFTATPGNVADNIQLIFYSVEVLNL